MATKRQFRLIVWAAFLALIPLAWNPLDRQLNEPTKAALTLVFTGLLVASAGRLPGVPRTRCETWIGAYIFVRWLSTAASIAPHWSLWGDPFWRNGLWLTMAGGVLFGLARRQITTPQARDPVISAILASSALVAGYGVIQYIGLNPLDLPKDGPRVASTQSYPILLSAYLVMVMPLTLARWETGRRPRIAALLALQGACLVFTFSRAGWLAALCGAAVWGTAHLWTAGRRRAARGVWAMMIAGLALMLLLSVLPPVPRHMPYALQTATSMFRWGGATVQTRLMGWEASLDAIRQRPWLGYGPATFRAVFEWFMPPDFAPFDGERTLAGRPHNAVLEVAVESGLVGLAAYVAMLGAILVPIARSAFSETRSGSRAFHRAVLAALIAALVYNLFSFECAASSILFWALAGMAHAQPRPAYENEPAGGVSLFRRGAACCALAGSLILAGGMIGPDILATHARELAYSGPWETGVRRLEDARRVSPTPDDILLALGRLYADRATQTDDLQVWRRGAAFYTDLITTRPDVSEYYRQQGNYFRRFYAQQGEYAAGQTALNAYTQAIRYSPANPNLWLARAMLRLDLDDPPGALADLQQADTLRPDYPGYYGGMAVYALSQGDIAAANAWNTRALEAQRAWDAELWSR